MNSLRLTPAEALLGAISSRLGTAMYVNVGNLSPLALYLYYYHTCYILLLVYLYDLDRRAAAAAPLAKRGPHVRARSDMPLFARSVFFSERIKRKEKWFSLFSERIRRKNESAGRLISRSHHFLPEAILLLPQFFCPCAMKCFTLTHRFRPNSPLVS